jgi:hypothetical protein
MPQRDASHSIHLLILSVLMLLPCHLAPVEAQPQNPPPQTTWGSVWQQVIRRRDQEKPRTSRGLICPVIPQLISQRVIWRDRPIFVWKGQAEKISVFDFANPQQPIWTRDRLGNDNSVTYAGKPLNPGTRYLWKAETGTEISQVIFQTLERSTRDQVTAQLMQLETQLNYQQVMPEERFQQRVQFFLNQNLFLDALQELYTVSLPSPELKALREQIVQVSCPNQPQGKQ